MNISHRERLEITISGKKPDRVPIALWRHFPVDDQHPERLAKATIAFQEQFDFDLVKVMPTSSFCILEWGVKDEWQGNIEGTRTYLKRGIKHPEDWEKLKVLDPYQGSLGQQLECLSHLQKAFSDHTPFIQTIFNPLSQAKNLVGSEELMVHLRRHPDALHHGLKTIQETTLKFIEAAKNFGISGIFLAIQHASYQILTEAEYSEFGEKYDKPLLEAAGDLWANMAHIHGEDIMFEKIARYPVQILNWHDRETHPSLGDGLKQFPGTACGGIGRFDSFVLGSTEKITQEVHEAIEQTNGKRLILGTGCVLPLTTPYGNIMTARESSEVTN